MQLTVHQEEWQKLQEEQLRRLQQEKKAVTLQSKAVAKLPTRRERNEVHHQSFLQA